MENKKYLKTGFCNLDTFNFEPGELVIIGARPSMGKTSFMLSILNNMLKNNYKCLYFSLESPKKIIIDRLIGQNILTNENKLEENAIINNNVANLCIIDTLVIGMKNIKNEIAKFKPDVVFIDYLQLIKSEKTVSRVESINKIITSLKTLAKEYHVTIFLNSQVSRELEERKNKRPVFSDLNMQETIKEIVDKIIFLYRDEYYNKENSSVPEGNTELIIYNNGENRTININFNHKYLKFEDIPQETN